MGARLYQLIISMPELSLVQQITVWVFPVIFALTIHEAAHAWMANRLGDSTAKLLGRVSFNPMKHIDLFGTIILPLCILLLSNFSMVFGWAKPVPINSSKFTHPRRDLALATAAGPLSNIIMALIWTACLKICVLSVHQISAIPAFIMLTARAGIIINILLAVLNLLPIPPLDGGKIVANLLPIKQAMQFEKIEPYGFFIMLALLLSGALNWLIQNPMTMLLNLISTLFNL
jgi:Zn-dependent protease